MIENVKNFLLNHEAHAMFENFLFYIALVGIAVALYFLIKYIIYLHKKNKKEEQVRLRKEKNFLKSLSYKKKENKQKII